MVKKESTTKPSSVSTGVALALSAFALSIFLYIDGRSFGSLSGAMAVALIVIGFAGLGLELDNLSREEEDVIVEQVKASGVFGNIGVGLALLVLWAALYASVTPTWGKMLAFPILLFGVFGTMLGCVNLLFLATQGGSGAQNGAPVSISATLGQGPLHRSWSLARKIAGTAATILGFIASLLQILQFFKIVW